MARIRTIKPEFPQSESLGRVSRDARLLFANLFTICDDAGRARASSRMLASLLYPYDDGEDGHIRTSGKDIDRWLTELEREGCVRRYEVDGNAYLDIPKWLDHQKIDHPSKSKLPEFREVFAKPREEQASAGESLALDRKGRDRKGEDREGIVADAPASGDGDDLDLPANLARGEEAEAVKTYNRVAEQFGWSECQKLTGSRKAKIRARLRDCGGLGGWSVAMTKAGESKFLRGEGKRGRGHENWKPDLDFFLSEEKFTQLMEGKYDDRTGPHDNGSLERDVLAGVGIEPGMEGVRRPAA